MKYLDGEGERHSERCFNATNCSERCFNATTCSYGGNSASINIHIYIYIYRVGSTNNIEHRR